MPKKISASVWPQAVIYQIYPRSFAEVRPTGQSLTGQGSLLGIINHLSYLADLGAKAIWLSPFYPSPMVDGGYDVADYRDVDPRFGTLQDFDALITAAQKNNLKVMIDLVINHTSNQHEWFKQSLQSTDNPKHDWYIWKDAKPDGSPPNNWASVFSRPIDQKPFKNRPRIVSQPSTTPAISAWTYHPQRRQYYLHSFALEQPDLNWQNPQVRQAMQDIMRYWLDRGVDGFRMDAVTYIGKDPLFRDELPNPAYREGQDNPYNQLTRQFSSSYTETLRPYLKELTNVLQEPPYAQRDLWITFEGNSRLQTIEQLNHIDPQRANAFSFNRMKSAWTAPIQYQALSSYYANLPSGAVVNQVNGNHDVSRVASRWGINQARAAAVLNATLGGQMYIYYGEEIGMQDVTIPLSQSDDILNGRDGCRTPMQWNSAVNAGFSQAESKQLWLPVAHNYQDCNVEQEMKDPLSSLNLYRALLLLRSTSPVLVYGQLDIHPLTNDHVLIFSRTFQDQQYWVITNFSDQPTTLTLPYLQSATVLLSSLSLSTHPNCHQLLTSSLTLQPQESLIISK